MQGLINRNRYTSKMIKRITGELPPTKPIIVVGNSVARKHLESVLKGNGSVALVGPFSCGKMTSVLEICDRLDLNVKISYDGSDFGDAPLRGIGDTVFVIRYTNSNKIFKKYVENGAKVVFIHTSDLPFKINTIYFHALNKADFDKYKELKGIPLYLNRPPQNNTIPLIKATADLLMGRSSPDDFHYNMDNVIAYNFDDPTIVQLCAMSAKTTDPLFKWGLLNMIRVPRLPMLKYPPKFKKKGDGDD